MAGSEEGLSCSIYGFAHPPIGPARPFTPGLSSQASRGRIQVTLHLALFLHDRASITTRDGEI